MTADGRIARSGNFEFAVMNYASGGVVRRGVDPYYVPSRIDARLA
jgi:hypothetical protein